MSRRPARHALSLLCGTPWLITEAALRQMIEIAARQNLTPEAVAAELGRPLDNTHTVTVRDGVATIPVTGPMFRRAEYFARVSGATSYDTLATDLTAALDDPAVHAIVLLVDSPGGEVTGLFELTQMIYEARERKRIISYVEGLGASAAYAIASAASEVVVAETAVLGSIGAVITAEDWSGFYEKNGVRRVDIVSSQSPKKRLNPTEGEGKAELQAIVDHIGGVFVRVAARHRGASEEVVLRDFDQGGIVPAPAAITAGLADRISTYETLHAELSAARGAVAPGAQTQPLTGRRTAEENRMASRTKPGTAASAAPGTPQAAAFAVDDTVRVTVARESPVLAEGDEGTIIEVRDGPHYAVRVGESGDYLWLSEDELEPAASGEGSGDAAPANTRARAGMTVATLEGRYPQLVAQLRTEGATAERERLAAIDAIATPGHANLVAKAKADPSATAATLALQILAADKEARGKRLSAAVEDEAGLDAPTPLASDATEAQGPQAEASRILSIHKQVNTPRRTA